MNIEEFYSNIFNSLNETQLKTVIEKRESLSKVHSFTDDLLLWSNIINPRSEFAIIKYAATEIQLSSITLVIGLYRQSFASLRLALELVLSAIYFSANELSLREWETGSTDIYWNQLIDPENGVLSNRFCKVFFPGLEDSTAAYLESAKKTYRELSEFVHGNIGTWEAIVFPLSFDESLFNKWMSSFVDISKVIIFSLCLKFLKHLDKTSINQLEAHILEQIGDIAAIRQIFDKAS